MERKIYIFIVLIALSSVLGCNIIVQQSPTEVVIAAYTAGNEGKYAETKKHFSSEFFSYIGGDFRAITNSIRDSWDRNTKKGTVERIEILKETVQETKATVKFILHFRDGSKRKFNEPLIKEKGVWKITL